MNVSRSLEQALIHLTRRILWTHQILLGSRLEPRLHHLHLHEQWHQHPAKQKCILRTHQSAAIGLISLLLGFYGGVGRKRIVALHNLFTNKTRTIRGGSAILFYSLAVLIGVLRQETSEKVLGT